MDHGVWARHKTTLTDVGLRNCLEQCGYKPNAEKEQLDEIRKLAKGLRSATIQTTCLKKLMEDLPEVQSRIQLRNLVIGFAFACLPLEDVRPVAVGVISHKRSHAIAEVLELMRQLDAASRELVTAGLVGARLQFFFSYTGGDSHERAYAAKLAEFPFIVAARGVAGIVENRMALEELVGRSRQK